MRISDWSSDVALPISSRSPNGQSRATDWWGIGINLDHRSHRFSDPARLAPAPCNFRRYVGTALIQVDRFSQTAFVKQTVRSEEHTSELQSLMRISYAVFCLKKQKIKQKHMK